MAGPGSDQAGENKYVRPLQKAIAGLSPGDAAGRHHLYDRGRSLLANRLREREDLTQAETEAEARTFDEAVNQVETQARAVASSFKRREAQQLNIATIAFTESRIVEVPPSSGVGHGSNQGDQTPSRPPPERSFTPRNVSGELGGTLDSAWKRAASQLRGAAEFAKRRMVAAVSDVRLRLVRRASRSAATDATANQAAPEHGVGRAAPTVLKIMPATPDGRIDGVANPLSQIRLQALIQVARHHGVDLDVNEFKGDASQSLPSAAAMSEWAQNAGLWSRAIRTGWRNLLRMSSAEPVVLLFKDGSAGLMVGAIAEQHVILMREPSAPPEAQPVAVDELRLAQVWDGEAILVRANRGRTAADTPFSLRWLSDLVLQEHRSLRDIGIASVTISFLTIFPPLLVMTMVNKVLQFHSTSTLILLSAVMAVVVVYEAILGHARRLIIAVVGARLDARLNLHVFNRLLRLPLDYFERHPAGETMFRIAQVYKVRQFLTGRLLTTFLDLITLCVLLPFLFYLSPILASIVLGCAVVILLIILAYLKPMREMYSRVTTAETWKSATLGETIVGIKTVKALALEPQRRSLWDERIAEAGKWQLAFSKLSNWPQTLVTPIERIMVIGTVMLGAYIAMNDPSGYMVGGLFAFLMLSGRAAQPLVGLARLIEEYEEIGAAIGEAASVLNRPAESNARSAGLRPKFAGEISFQDVTFTYIDTTVPALDRVAFSMPAGTTLGIVGRSGSGKSTITRLLQGINRDYKGFVKIDGVDLRDVDLRHLRQSLGVVLQENFLFRGSIRDNIIAGRPGLTLSDAVYAARLAGAEEFIERMPNGFDTYIEEGSPNLSGGQRQRLAIARALITDPRILILDEATSALDPESEAVVTSNLERIASGRTMIIVSHRLSSLVACDQILVLEQGHIVDCGRHDVLVERCAIYRQLWNQQNRHITAPKPSAAPRLVTGGPEQ
ncbi:peptidase domain-containing ABC transporter [Bradyrhizobium altum]|uniref:peptidase domain-containing ABC transporter n=1 Tax=Bradyrhizobium altum TaxID=1571202 RepID=UPI001E3CB804|nr:peptidase domain-containing ABC transporter [Bradyrhizobium altum]